MFTGDLTSEQGKQEYENYIMNNVRNEINSYTKQSQVNNASSSVSGASGSLTTGVVFPSGVIVPFAGGPGVTPNPGTRQDVPNGWLLCDGAAVSRTAYSALFTIIGTTYGVGDGSTTFNLPDMRGNVPVGVKSTQTSNPDISTLNKNPGAYTRTLNNNDLPNHTHSLGGTTGSFNASHSHAHSLGASTIIAFANTQRGTSAGSILIPLQSGANLFTASGSITGSITSQSSGTGGSLDHSHTLPANTGDNGSTPVAVSLVQPSISLNYIIKT